MELSEKKKQKLKELYEKYVSQIMEIEDIKPWCTRKTLSSTMQESERANETKVLKALEGTDYREGDRFFTYYKQDDSIGLSENFKNDHNRPRLLKNLYNTAEIFDTILPVKTLFLNYSLKKNYAALTGQEIKPVTKPTMIKIVKAAGYHEFYGKTWKLPEASDMGACTLEQAYEIVSNKLLDKPQEAIVS